MIRLSESMARMHCCDEVQPKHVKEAFRLLNKSIIRVETPEINFETEEPQVLPEEEGEGEREGGGEGGPVNGIANGHLTNGDAEPVENGEVEKPVKPVSTTRKLKVTYEQYRTIANLLIMHLRHVEETEEEGIFGMLHSYSSPVCVCVCVQVSKAYVVVTWSIGTFRRLSQTLTVSKSFWRTSYSLRWSLTASSNM